MVEFTGERVVPGQVNEDLWSEHIARYAFARRYAEHRRVLDAGCGTGYGSAELAQAAQSVVGMDLSPAAAQYGRANYPLANLAFAAGSCQALPFPDGAFDLVVAFEVIEHIADYPSVLREAARVLTPDGLLIVSTPNQRYYAESRAVSGPNPYHAHEFQAEEFRHALEECFDHVTLLLQNRVESFAFHPVKTFWPADARIDGGAGTIADGHFFIALCSQGALPPLRSFSYVPRAANVLREREQHVQLLETELHQTKQWLDQIRLERNELLDLFRKQKQELEAHNRWAEQLNRQLDEAHTRIGELQSELTSEQAAAAEVAAGYERKVLELDAENVAKTHWAMETDARLTAELQQRGAELAECVRLLQQAESTMEERTLWAQRAETDRARLAGQINAARSSRWLKLGKRLGLGPVLQEP